MTTKNLEMVSGDDVVFDITVMDSHTDTPVSLVGCSARFVIAKSNSRRILVTKTTGDEIAVTDPVNGMLEVSLAAADTADLEGDYQYELQIIDTLGNRTTPLKGLLTIDADLIEE